jgi:hypothetical protein
LALIDALLEPLTLAIIAIAVVGFAAIAYVLRKDGGGLSTGKGGRKSIDVLRPRDKRAFTMPITAETEIAIQCPKKEGTHWRFYKSGPGWTFPNGAVKFHGIEGTAYTAVVKNDKPVTMKLQEALRVLWGDDAYDKTPPKLKEIVEKHQMGVTIYPEKIPEEDKATSLSAANIDDENDEKVLTHVAKKMQSKGKMDWMTFLQGAAIGLAVCYILTNMHWLPVASK